MKKNRRDTDCSAKPPSARAGRTLFSLVIVWLFSAAAVSQAAYVDEVLADKPAGYWRLGDAAPLPPPDVATNLGSLAAAGDGVYAGAYTRPVAGTLAGDTAVAFLNPSLGTGYSGAVNVPNSAALNPDGAFTIEFWAKPSNATASLLSPVNSMSFTSGRAGYLFYQNGATWQLRIGVTTSTTASLINGGTVRANEWQHVVGVYSGGASGTMTLFVDGVQVSAGAATYEVNTDAPFSIGSTSLPNRTFDGAVDEVALYSAALSAGTIAAHFEARTTNAANYASQILLDSPVGYWRLSEPAPPPQPTAENLGSLGTAANGAYINGAIGGQPGAITGDANTAAAFAGDNDKIDVPFHAGLNPSAFTIECWAKVAGGAGNHRSPLTARDDTPPGTTAGYIFYATPGDTWEFWTGTGGGAAGPWHVQGGPPLTEGEWAHLVGTFDGKTKKFYVNGALHAIGETTVIANKLRPLRIGGGATEGAGNFFFNGDVDEAAVYDTVLSPDRVLAHFASGAGMDPIPVAPIIAAEPQTQTVFLGQKISLNVAALGSLPLSHQWKKGGNPIPGATGPAYTIESAALTDAGAYSVEVTNSGGAVSSAEAVVTVLNISIPDITRPPQPVTVYGGGTARFHVVATGSPNLTYQWQFGTANLPDETNATLVVREVQLAQQGDYRVLVTDEAGTTPSAAALLTVIVPPAKSYAAFIMA
ncbi:MAG: hypothetical protein HY674_05090, partial [Chloroflexi bacterium]|nr:hypothetical protein [Chloroflexota bacterium]